MDMNEPMIRRSISDNEVTKHIPFDKITTQLRQKFLSYQSEIFFLIGYNLEYMTPHEVIDAFKENYWRDYLKNQIVTQMQDKL